jgi:hypothetical protein
MKVTTNLCDILRRVRYTDRTRILWADAISINQEDLMERKRQVCLMGLIFTDARQVLAWLGRDRGDAEKAVRFNYQILQLLRRSGRRVSCEEINHSLHKNDKEWKAVKRMFASQFFSRIWTIQELGLASNTTIFYGLGKVEVPWPTVFHFACQVIAKAFMVSAVLDIKLNQVFQQEVCTLATENQTRTTNSSN